MPDVNTVAEWEYRGLRLRVNREGGPLPFAPHRYKPGTGWYCGYAMIPYALTEAQVERVETNADVHGGITYAETSTDGVTFGFDCAHAMSGPKTRDLEWVKAETQRMADSILELLEVR